MSSQICESFFFIFSQTFSDGRLQREHHVERARERERGVGREGVKRKQKRGRKQAKGAMGGAPTAFRKVPNQ